MPLTLRLTVQGCLLAAFLAGAPSAVEAAASEQQARAHFRRAETAFRQRKFDEALASYQAAYDARALPGLLFNVAQCHRYLGNHERAIFFYERYLEVASGAPDRDRTLGLIAEQRAELERKRVSPPPLGSLAHVDLGVPPPVVQAPPSRLPLMLSTVDRAGPRAAAFRRITLGGADCWTGDGYGDCKERLPEVNRLA